MKNQCGIASGWVLAVWVWMGIQGTGLAASEKVVLDLGVIPEKMRFDREWLRVPPGAEVELRFRNSCRMQHNVLICQPGKDTAWKVAQLAWGLGGEALQREYVPESPLVIWASSIVNPGEERVFHFTAPKVEGDYPYVCTLPGHAITMRGLFRVGGNEVLGAQERSGSEIPVSGVERAGQPMKQYRQFMVNGPFLSGVILPGNAAEGLSDGLKPWAKSTPKGIAVALEGEGQAGMVFDTDLLRWSAGWMGGFLRYLNGREDERAEYRHEMDGTLQFLNPPEPGWRPLNGQWNDPRKNHLGLIPKNWAAYLGLYQFNQRVVMHYSVGETLVWDTPDFVGTGENRYFIRTVRMGPSEEAWVMRVGGGDGIEVRIYPPEVGMIQEESGVFQVVLNPSSVVRTFQVAIGTDMGSDVLWPKEALKELEDSLKGGSHLWPEKVVTHGVVGQGEGPYVVDTLTLPFDNPWNAVLYTGGLDFFSNGDAALCTSHGDVWTVSGIDETLHALTWRRIATGLSNPLGLRIVDDEIYVVGLDQITRLKDLNGDGGVDYYECFNNDCQVTDSHHRFVGDLQTDSKGNFYYVKCSDEGNTEHGGSMIRVSPDGKHFELFATGLRNPNGMGMGPGDFITFGKQQGTWIPSSGLHVVRQGGFYGYMPSHHRVVPPTDFEKPLCWIPHGVDNSCGGQVWIPETCAWGPLAGQLLHLSYGKCQMFLVYRQEISGGFQGGVVRVPGVEFEAGAMRGRIRAQDQWLYVTGLRGWQTTAAMAGCFQRVRYGGGRVSWPKNVTVIPGGIRLEFHEKLDPVWAERVEGYRVQAWDYRWTQQYGSAEYRPSNPEEKGRDEWKVLSAKISHDGFKVDLGLSDLRPVMQLQLDYHVKEAMGEDLTGSLFHTIHEVPVMKN